MRPNSFWLTACLCLTVTLADARQPADKPYKAYVVSNAHFDTQWNWDVQTSIRKGLLQTIEQNCWLIENYPDYIFNFEGGVKYQWMKEYYPLLYDKVVRYVKQGRWYPAGACWDATDPIVPSTESAFRNILLGQQWYKQEFGVRSDDLFLPDSFGFGYAMPTIAAHAGLIGFSTNKFNWRYVEPKYPFQIGLWQGVDGSRIMSVLSGARYDLDWQELDLSRSQKLIDRARESGLGVTYNYYGVGDEGGAPSVFSAEAVQTGLRGDGPVQILSANSAQLYKDYLPFSKHPELPVHDGELLMDRHGTACYTVHAEMKLLNRRNEQLGAAAEQAAVMADYLGGLPYPAATLTEAWRRFIWHQFHDDLTGTSLPKAYEFSWNDELLSQTQFADVMHTASAVVASALDTRAEGTPLVIYNPTAYDRHSIVEAEIPAPGTENLIAWDPDGNAVPVQVLSSVGGRSRIAFAARVPSAGYAVYDIRPGQTAGAVRPAGGERTVENSVYKITVNEKGEIASIRDKRYDREMVQPGKTIRLALFTENPGDPFPSWEIYREVMEAEPASIDTDVRIETAEQGPVRHSLCIRKRYEDSEVTQWIRLSEGADADRIDVVTEMEWNTLDCLLKNEFPLTAGNPEATYDLDIGSIRRGNNTDASYEVYAQQWADLTAPDGSYGVSILSDCKYGWDKPDDNTLRLTLLHIPSVKAAGLRYGYQARQDIGRHRFTYSLVGHAGDHRQAGTVRKAEEMNRPLIAYLSPKHAGTLGKQFSFVRSSTPQIAVKMVKKAEEGDSYVVRIYETEGKKAENATLTFPAPIAEARELNACEEVLGKACVQGDQLLVSTEPYRPKTYSVKLKSAPVAVESATSIPVEIPYTHIGISPDGYYTTIYNSDGYFDHANHSYAAELLPRTLTTDGIDFAIGKPGLANVLKCQGERIELPQDGKSNRLYILAAATDRDRRATFRIDGQAYTFDIPYYSGYYGQWGWRGFAQGFIRQADIAHIGTHRHSLAEGNEPYVFTYIYKLALDLPAGARVLEMPDDSHIGVFAVTAAHVPAPELAPATEVRSLPQADYAPEYTELDPANILAGRNVTNFSNRRLSPQECRAPKALDGEEETLWKDWFDDPVGKPKFMEIDLGRTREFNHWSILHDGWENPELITSDFRILVKDETDDDWRCIADIRDNRSNRSEETLSETVRARYVRLEVTKGSRHDNKQVSIREFAARKL